MNICGNGRIPGGEYENISISGKGKLFGNVKCGEFRASGSVSGESLECTENMKLSGFGSFSESVTAQNVRVSGSFSCGALTVKENLFCAGKLKINGNVNCKSLNVKGAASFLDSVTAECAEVSGAIKCESIVKADKLSIKADGKSYIGCAEAEKVSILAKKIKSIFKRIPLLSRAFKNFTVCSYVKATEVELEYVDCPLVTGRTVKIGRGCNIELVEYTESIEISDKANVMKIEKI